MNSPIKEYIYILELNGGNYYVGKTKDIVKRFNDHKSQKGSAWTRQHGGCKIVELYECTSLFDEDKYTLEYMNTVGVDNVRGGSYAYCVLTTEQRDNITRALRNANNLCMTCGESDHFSDMCSQTFKSEVIHNTTYNAMHTRSAQGKDILNDVHTTMHSMYNNELNFPHVRYLSPTGIVHDNTENGTEKISILNTTHSVVNNISSVGSVGNDYSSSCGRCGRSNHVTTKCYAKTDIHGKML